MKIKNPFPVDPAATLGIESFITAQETLDVNEELLTEISSVDDIAVFNDRLPETADSGIPAYSNW